MTTETKIAAGREFVKKVEADLGYELDSHILDLFFDNAEELGFSDDDCFEVGNVIRTDKGMSPTPKWWS